MPTKTPYIRLIQHYSEIYEAMLDELPNDLWIELHERVMKRMRWAWDIRQCTSFKVVD